MANWGNAVGPFRLAEHQSDCTLLNSCFAVLGLETLNGLINISSDQQRKWMEYIKSYQVEGGLFIDPLLDRSDLESASHDYQYISWQMNFFSLAAIDALGGKPTHPLSFLDDFLHNNDLERWLETRNWTDPWLESNNIMFLLSFLIREWERSHCVDYEEAIDKIIKWLDSHQNPQTGYWDLGAGASLLNAMAGAFHFYFFYFYLDRRVNHPERIIDSTLSLQQADGLFVPVGGGSACLDLDAVDILVKFSMLTDYRHDEVKSALTRAFQAILLNQNTDGGFCEAKRPPLWEKSIKRKVAESIGVDKLLLKPWQGRPIEYTSYAGWQKMVYQIDKSDLWSTWFRSLALALISKRYPDEFISQIDWHFRDTPSLGWHDTEKIQRIRMQHYA